MNEWRLFALRKLSELWVRMLEKQLKTYMFESTIYVFAYSFVFDFVSCTILLPGDIMLFFPYL